jgi:hypothetical protein
MNYLNVYLLLINVSMECGFNVNIINENTLEIHERVYGKKRLKICGYLDETTDLIENVIHMLLKKYKIRTLEVREPWINYLDMIPDLEIDTFKCWVNCVDDVKQIFNMAKLKKIELYLYEYTEIPNKIFKKLIEEISKHPDKEIVIHTINDEDYDTCILFEIFVMFDNVDIKVNRSLLSRGIICQRYKVNDYETKNLICDIENFLLSLAGKLRYRNIELVFQYFI